MNPQNRTILEPIVHCRLAMAGGFAFATGCTERIGIANVTRSGAGDYTVTLINPVRTTNGWTYHLGLLGVTPAAGYAASVTQLSGTSFRITAATGGALADVGTFDFTIHEIVGAA